MYATLLHTGYFRTGYMLIASLFLVPRVHDEYKTHVKDKPRDMPEMIDSIRAALKSIGDGQINVSAYDTACVALVKNVNGGDGPQFPSSIDWIVQNQLPDGSWGDKKYFLVHDRIINTLACIVALKSWNIHHDKCRKVPFTYPVDIFERLWVVDRLERLGISRYFTSEIAECLDYAYRHWTQEGLPATRDCPLNDIDDTAMGFRLLRLHGYRVSPGVFKNFERDGEFVCYPGQSNQSVTATHNLYRAAQVAFPGEDELQRANTYSRSFLNERRASGKLKDKWVIAKDLPGEVAYALDFPWRASLPRIETRMYLEQYGGSADVWIGKVLYRMPLISNDLYLDAAKADFSSFQRRCRIEWHGLRKWYDKNNLGEFGVSLDSALRAYFLAAANIFEPSRAAERLAWARTAMIAQALSWHLQFDGCNDSKRERLIHKLESHGRDELARSGSTVCSAHLLELGQKDPTEEALLSALFGIINLDADGNASSDLREAVMLIFYLSASGNLINLYLWLKWKRWVRSWTEKASHESCEGSTALLLVHTAEICSGRHRLTKKNWNVSEYSHLEQLTSSICSKLASTVLARTEVNTENIDNSDIEVDLEMQELTQFVLQVCSSINKVTRLTFLHVAKSCYYVAHCTPVTIKSHISKVIFEDVI
ncbi:hypothetical protein EJB05_21164, partial [Eragrostis curvula]